MVNAHTDAQSIRRMRRRFARSLRRRRRRRRLNDGRVLDLNNPPAWNNTELGCMTSLWPVDTDLKLPSGCLRAVFRKYPATIERSTGAVSAAHEGL